MYNNHNCEYNSNNSSSSTDATLSQHFSDIANKAGISTVVISWYPPGFSDDHGAPELADGLLPRLLDAAQKVGLTVAGEWSKMIQNSYNNQFFIFYGGLRCVCRSSSGV
jgi:hypothetical protein